MHFSYAIKTTVLLLAGSLIAAAQLTPQQREEDFRAIVSRYVRMYAPANWKQQALGVNLFDLTRWMPRVRAARTDREYFKVVTEYVASLKDGHSVFRMPSTYGTGAQIAVDIYDDKVLLEEWDRTEYPASEYDWRVGDELVSLDGKPVDELMREFARDIGFGNEKAVRRMAAERLVLRAQSVMPNAPDTPDTSQAVFRNAAGELKTYTLNWLKVGTPIENLSPVPSPFTLNSERDPLSSLRKLRNWSWKPYEQATMKMQLQKQTQEWGVPQYVRNLGTIAPVFNPPPGWRQRLGTGRNDVFLSGTYVFEGKRIGFIRIPNFLPPDGTLAVSQMQAEIAFFKANTDGLVVDLMRNTGGGCVGLDYAKLLIPERFWFFGDQVLANRYWLNQIERDLQAAMESGAEAWVIATYEFYLEEIGKALRGSRAMTGPVPACAPTTSREVIAPTFENEPARAANGTLLAYDKPVIFLMDEFSASFGDIFPAVMQDNRRGLLVGTRTAGLGGAVIDGEAGFYGEGSTSVTITLTNRRQDIVTTEFPTAPFIENIGVRPDRELDYMTRENLLRGGAPFVQAFSRILVGEIDRNR